MSENLSGNGFVAFLEDAMEALAISFLVVLYTALVIIVVCGAKKATDHDEKLSWPVKENEMVLLECNCTCFVSGAANSSSSAGSAGSSGTNGRVRLVQKKQEDKKISIIVREDNKTGRILLSHETPTRISRMASRDDRADLDATKFILAFGDPDVAGEFKAAFERAQGLDLVKGLRLWGEMEWMDLMKNHSTIPLEVIGAAAIYRGWNVDNQSELRKTVSTLTTKVNTLENENIRLLNQVMAFHNENTALRDAFKVATNEYADLKNKVAALETWLARVPWYSIRVRPCPHLIVLSGDGNDSTTV